MEAKYTKGNWSIDPLDSLSIRDDSVDFYYQLICQTNGKGREEAEANAKLISCAPEMLEALKELLRFKYELRHVMGDKLQYPENFLKAIDSAEKVIKKATE